MTEKLPSKQCPQCEKTFTPTRSDKRFCSDKCRWNFANAERLAALKAFRGNGNA